MYYYPNYNLNYPSNERQFLVPFLLGGLGGAAIVGASRPRPIYINRPNSYYPSHGPYGYNYYGGYNYNPSPYYR